MDINVSELYCGMNGAMYFVEMDEYGGKGLGHNQAGAKYGTGYCDAQVRKSMAFPFFKTLLSKISCFVQCESLLK